MIQFSGVWVPLVTPLRHGALDLPALSGLVEHLSAQGVHGFVACGSTGEAALLDDDEQQTVLRTIVEAAGDRPVLMGLSGPRPAQVAERAKRLAEHHRVAGYLVTAPAYLKPAQAGILDFFTAVADASPLPIVAYDIPARTGVRIEPSTLLALAAHPRIRALKDCSADAGAATALLADGRLALLAGNDDELFAQLALGASGSITASAHLRPDLFVRLHRLFAEQRLAEARTLWYRLRPLITALFAEPNPAPLKAMLAREGRLADELRAPMTAASAGCVERARQALAALDAQFPR